MCAGQSYFTKNCRIGSLLVVLFFFEAGGGYCLAKFGGAWGLKMGLYFCLVFASALNPNNGSG